MSESPTLDEAARASAANPEDVDAKAKLWKAIIELPVWWFVPRAQGNQISPMALALNGKPTLAAFTTGARCRTFAQRKGVDFVEAKEGLAIPPAEILKFFPAWQEAGVWGLVFDPTEHGLTAPLPSLQAMLKIAEPVEE